MHVQCIGIQYVQQKFGFCYFSIDVVKSIAFKAFNGRNTHWCGCIPFSIILLSTFAKQINDAVVCNLRRVSYVNLLLNFKNKQYSGCCQWHTSKPGPDSDSDPDSDSKKIRTREKPGPGLEKNPDSCLTKPGLDF